METKIVILDKDYPNMVNGLISIKDHTFGEACRILKEVEKDCSSENLTECFITQLAIEGWLFTYTNDVCSISL